jgi:hypothetical protein
MELGNPSFGCELPPIDFVAFARACGADGFHCERAEEVRPAIQAALPRQDQRWSGPLSTRSEASRPGRTEDLGRYRWPQQDSATFDRHAPHGQPAGSGTIGVR